MLENEIDHKQQNSKHHRGTHNKESGALQLAPGWPGDLLCQLAERFFAIVNELSHLYFIGLPPVGSFRGVC